MRAIVLRKGEHAPRLVERPEPARREVQALARTLYAGLDGTDDEVLSGAHGAFPEGRDELVLGHECLGEVVEAPEGSGLAPGDRVVPLVRHGCGQCVACLRHADFCPTEGYREHGIKGLDGFYRDLWADDPATLVKAPAGIGSLAVLTEPLSIVVKAYEEARRIQRRIPWFEQEDEFRGKRALLAGTGSLGTVGCFLLRSEGMDVWAMDREPEDSAPAKLLSSLGVKHVDARETKVADLAREVGGFDLVIEATGVPEVAFDCVQTLAGNGVMAMLGVPEERPPFAVPGDDIMRQMVLQNQAMFGSVNSGRRHFEVAMRRLAEFRARWPHETERIVTHVFAPQEVEVAYKLDGPQVIKKVLDWTAKGVSGDGAP
ncbi:MAG: glucose 1-dehydrogenase [Thermoplasmata archaeon]|jgi:threonine dehydrogenase-like Zn-dependent dehydrogenase|nr:glucose 1-dehydrogenase [Thermoplasmata archaeon]